MSGPKLTGSRCMCRGCGELFNSTSTFDRHRTGTFAPLGAWAHNRRCLTPAELEAKGWCRNGASFWIERPRQAATAHTEGPPSPPGASGVQGALDEAA